MGSLVLTNYQFDLIIGRHEARKFLEIMNDEAGDLLDRRDSRETWFKKAIDDLYFEFVVNKKRIKRRHIEAALNPKRRLERA